ncbi:MAG TPA: DUF3857 domain-containing protein [Terriglobales bacterium]
MTFARWVVLLSLFSLTTSLLGASDAPPITPDELKMTSDPLAPGAPAVILYRQVDRDDSGQTAHEHNFVRIKVFKDEGRKYGDVEIPFYKEHGLNIVNVHARTVRPDGSEVPFQGKVFEKMIEKAKGVKLLARTFSLPEVQPGCIIEYSYTMDLSENYVYDSHWILSDELFTHYGKFSLKPYSGFYSNLHVRWSWHLLPAGSDPPKQGPDQIVRMEVHNVPAFQTEDYMPPANELKSRVDFTYGEDFEKDATKYWKDIGKKLNGTVEGFVGKPKSLEDAAGQIVSASDSPEVKLQKIYARVQQIRNTSYEVRKTEQEQKREKQKDNSHAEDVWKRGYGTGGELNWLFLGLARAAGFEAYAVFASDRNNYFFDPAIMDSYKLDEDLVLVKVNGKDVFCDPGAAFTPYGLLEWPETGVTGLRLDKDGGTWIQTMIPASAESRIIRKADITVATTGDLDGKLTLTFTGLEAMQRRREERNEDDQSRKKLLEDQAQEYIPTGSELELTNKPDWSASSAPLVAEFSLKVPGWISAAGRRALLPVGIFAAREKQVFAQEMRVHPVYFRYPFQTEDDITITLPPDWQVTSLPAIQNIDAKAALYSLTVTSFGTRLQLTRKLNIDFLFLEQKLYPALRAFFQTVRTGDDEQIVLQPANATASN